MEDIDERYENGVIYMIKHKTDDKKEFYIGSSYNFKKRCWDHKKDCNKQNRKNYNYKVYKYIRDNDGWDAWTIVKLYDYPCKNKNDLKLEEQRAVKKYKSTLNTQIPGRTKKEHYEDNKEKLLQYQKEYRKDNKEKLAQYEKKRYEANKEKILQQKAMKINCDICNSLVHKGYITKHKRSEKCKNSHK